VIIVIFVVYPRFKIYQHMKKRTTFLLSLLVCIAFTALAQEEAIHPSSVITGTYHGVSKALRDLPPMTATEFMEIEKKAMEKQFNEGLRYRSYPFAATALPKGEDPAWQKVMGSNKNRSPIMNFNGQTSPYYPPDDNGVPGPNHYMQTINTVYAIYDKSGTLVAGPTNLNLLFGNVPGANRNDGDPIILYDEEADRWLVTEFSIPIFGPNYMLVAVSTTNDPTGTWHQYSFSVDAMPDYPKFGIWLDGYYMGVNNSSGNDIYVFEREPMLSGGAAQAVAFNNPWRPASSDGFMCVPPLDNDGEFAPAGSPGLYIAFNDDALGGGSDQLWIYELDIDWTNPSAATFERVQQIDVLPFNASFGPTWNNIIQPGTGQKLDGIPQVVMNVPQYRNFGSFQTIVCCHTVNVDGFNHAGIRWYELRRTTGDWSVRQQGTYAPDDESRWMGSIMLNGSNKIALGYSISSSTVFPGIRYCGQSPAEYASASGLMDIQEDTIYTGEYSQNGGNRWGDYSLMAVDPVDDETFWYTNQYVGPGGSRRTRIASFQFITGPSVTTLAATNVTSASATLNGSVNPQGEPTTYYFKYGTNPGSLTDSTDAVSAGSGTTVVDVSEDIAGLTSNETYYFRIVAVNPSGTSFGSDLNFSTGTAASLTVVPPNQNVGTMAGNTEFYVTSNMDWTVESDASWCSVTPSGTNIDTIFATYNENTSFATRTANITVSATGAPSKTVTVTQEGILEILEVSPSNRNVANASGATEFYVTSNSDWQVVSNASWCSVTQVGTGNDTIFVTFTENASTASRIATINVSATAGSSRTVTVTQAGAPLTLLVGPPNQNVPAKASETSFTVTSNTSWTVGTDASWCIIKTPSGSGNGTIDVSCPANLLGQQRIADIAVSAVSVPTQHVTVTQASSIGVDEMARQELRIYPNPNTGSFRILPAENDNGTLKITVQDMNGVTVFKKELSGKKEYKINIPSASQGLYHIIVKTESNLHVRKLVILK